MIHQTVFKSDRTEVSIEDFIAELWPCVQTAHRLLRGTDLELPAAPAEEQLHFMLRLFRSLVPADYDFNIEEVGKRFCLCIYAECEFPWQFHGFHIRPVIQKLARANPKLLEVFIDFLRLFSSELGILPWYKHYEYYVYDQLDAMIEYGDEPVPIIAAARKCLELYRKGEPHRYEEQIRLGRPYSAEEVLQRLEALRCRKRNPVASIIRSGCQLVQEGWCWEGYDYRHDDNEDTAFLPIFQQVGIIWAWADLLQEEFEGFLDAEAQEGVQVPYATLYVKPDTKVIDFAAFERQIAFPMQLHHFMDDTLTAIVKYTADK